MLNRIREWRERREKKQEKKNLQFKVLHLWLRFSHLGEDVKEEFEKALQEYTKDWIIEIPRKLKPNGSDCLGKGGG